MLAQDHGKTLRSGVHLGLATWDKALANEGLLADDVKRLPAAGSDRATQMTSGSTRSSFADLGIEQSFTRPRTPTDNATAQSWMATRKMRAALRCRHRRDDPRGGRGDDRGVHRPLQQTSVCTSRSGSSPRPSGTRAGTPRSSKPGGRGCDRLANDERATHCSGQMRRRT